MKIKLSYDKREDLPAGYEELYDEKDGKFVLTGVEGMKTEGDIARLSTSLANERKAHKETKEKFKVFEGLDPTEVHEKLDRVEELEAENSALKSKADGKGTDEQAIERIVETRVKRAMAPVERERDALKTQLETATKENGSLKGTISQGRVENAVRKVATDMKVVGTALDDVLLNANAVFEVAEDGSVVTKEAAGLTPGLTPDVWMKDMQEKRPHWWATSVGGGANGANGKLPNGQANPWSAGGWNLTQQGQYLREHGADKAGQLAKIAGTTVGGPKPDAKAA